MDKGISSFTEEELSYFHERRPHDARCGHSEEYTQQAVIKARERKALYGPHRHIRHFDLDDKHLPYGVRGGD